MNSMGYCHWNIWMPTTPCFYDPLTGLQYQFNTVVNAPTTITTPNYGYCVDQPKGRIVEEKNNPVPCKSESNRVRNESP